MICGWDLITPTAATRRVQTYAGGVNWYATLGLRAMLDLEYTHLEAAAPLTTAPSELLFIGRVQLVL